MRVLLTGATGFIGSALVQALVERGDRVRAIVRASSRTGLLERLGVERVLCDLSDREGLLAAVQGAEVVFHVAGAVKVLRPRDFLRVNTEGTRLVAEACARASSPPRLVYLSSLAAAGPSALDRPRREEDPEAPVSLYGYSKLEGERAVREFAGRVKASIVRPPIVYGRGDCEFLPLLARMARVGLSVQAGLGEKRYSTLHVHDLSQGLLAVAERGREVARAGSQGIYFLDDGEAHPWAEIGAAACGALGRRAVQLRLPSFLGFAGAAGAALGALLTRRPAMLSFDKLKEVRVAAWTCSSERARRELGYRPRYALEAGMKEALAPRPPGGSSSSGAPVNRTGRPPGPSGP
ncbi:MAG TPA: NAD-dependent epimerase/dehydratase family protein [Anaeromyxobacteraceae bacterium]|nr:NAD-dependent epimerase/dehydratase family protein [Anaeromyxobacteraceae bacterium]